jgi:hypothetical protein
VPLLARAAEWAAGVGANRGGAEWAELALAHADPGERADLLALRAPPPRGGRYLRPGRLRRGDRGGALPSACRRCGCSRRGRAWRPATSRAPPQRWRGVQGDPPSSSRCAAWSPGTTATGRALTGSPRRRTGWPPARTSSPISRACSPTSTAAGSSTCGAGSRTRGTHRSSWVASSTRTCA